MNRCLRYFPRFKYTFIHDYVYAYFTVPFIRVSLFVSSSLITYKITDPSGDYSTNDLRLLFIRTFD